MSEIFSFFSVLTDWINLDGSSYKFVNDNAATANYAEDLCREDGGHLIWMETAEEFDMIRDIIEENFG